MNPDSRSNSPDRDPQPLRRAVFLDRDGVLNRDSPSFIKSPDELVLFEGVPRAVGRLNLDGFIVVVVTNQSGIPRGLLTEETLAEIHARLRREIEAGGGRIDAIYHCPHLPGEGCACRKPAPGMLLEAARDYGIDLAGSFLIGDKPEDIAAGVAAGCRTVLVLTGKTGASSREAIRSEWEAQPDFIAGDVSEAVEWIARQSATRGAPPAP